MPINYHPVGFVCKAIIARNTAKKIGEAGAGGNEKRHGGGIFPEHGSAAGCSVTGGTGMLYARMPEHTNIIAQNILFLNYFFSRRPHKNGPRDRPLRPLRSIMPCERLLVHPAHAAGHSTGHSACLLFGQAGDHHFRRKHDPKYHVLNLARYLRNLATACGKKE